VRRTGGEQESSSHAPHASAAPSIGIFKGYWTWVSPDGRTTVSDSDGSSPNFEISPNYPDAVMAPAGTTVSRYCTFDISHAARGGTFKYVDGNGTTYQWKMPTTTQAPKSPRSPTNQLAR
jgi:hypothetical protein